MGAGGWGAGKSESGRELSLFFFFFSFYFFVGEKGTLDQSQQGGHSSEASWGPVIPRIKPSPSPQPPPTLPPRRAAAPAP